MYSHFEISDHGISIVLGSYNRKNFIRHTIKTIRDELHETIIPYEIIVIDGGSNDGTIPWLTSQKDIITIIQHNRGTWKNIEIPRRSWGYFINLGFKTAKGKYICMLSDDCLVIPGAIKNGYNYFNDILKSGKKVGAVAFYWRDWPIMDEYAVHTHFGIININHGLFLRSALIEVNYADEDSYSFYYGDVDLTYKLMNNGYEIITCKTSFIEHFLHANLKSRVSNLILAQKDRLNFIHKWNNNTTAIANIQWEENESNITLEYKDTHNTIALFYPYSRMIRLSQYSITFFQTLTHLIGEEKIKKSIPVIRNYLNKSNNPIMKKIQFLLYSLNVEEKILKN